MNAYIIRPTEITDAMLISTNIPETDSTKGEWTVGTAFMAGDTCRVTTTGIHNVYEALVNVTGGSSPEVDVLAATPKWLDTGKTNRWKPFDKVIGSQASQASPINYVLKPGITDSLSIQNVEATSIQVVLADQSYDTVTNGTAWTGATGTTQPTGWDKVGTPSDYLIDSGALKITAAGNNEGISQTITVVPGTEMQFLGIYRNIASDIAQYAVYDVTHSADILATTDLASSIVDSTLSYIFTVPAGCTSIKISLLAKSTGNIVWFDTVSLAPTVYNETTNLVSTINVIDEYTYWFEDFLWKTSLTVSNIPPYPSATVTVIVTNQGGTAKCGAIIPGVKLELGKLQLSPQPGLDSFSTLTENTTFGTWSVVKRSTRRKMQFKLFVEIARLDFIMQQMALYDSELLVWVGYESLECLAIYGFYRTFTPSIDYNNWTIIDVEVRGII